MRSEFNGHVIPVQQSIGRKGNETLYELEDRFVELIGRVAQERAIALSRMRKTKEVSLWRESYPQVFCDILQRHSADAAAAAVLGWLRSPDAAHIEGLREAVLESLGAETV